MTTHTTEKPTIGILAFGSLISNPGPFISKATVGKPIEEQTPFAVEFARKSTGTRGGAPTLVPVNKGKHVKCKIFAMKPKLSIQNVANLLYSREKHLECKIDPYTKGIEDYRFKTHNQSEKEIIVSYWPEFAGLSKVLFADLVANLITDNAKILACKAIISVEKCEKCDKSGFDGISYLIDALDKEINTCLSSEYEAEILKMTGTKCLPKALEAVKGNLTEYVNNAKNELNNLRNSA